MKKCYKCGETENLYRYAKKSFMCRTCNTIKKREYRSTAKGRAAVKKAVAKPMYVIFLCPLHHKQAHLEKVVV